MFLVSGFAASAEQSCSVDGSAFADGASYCLSAVKDGKVQKVLFKCSAGAWTSTDVLCPDQYAYFCQVGPHSVAVGERLLLGSGPAVLACNFPGVLSVEQAATAPDAATTAPPSRAVRNVQHYLSDEDAGLNCATDPCDGRVDDKTLAALVNHVRRNLANLNDADKKSLGIANAADIEIAIRGKSPIDVIPVFVAVFDVPNAD
jgi:hypothetical protein